MNIAHSEFAPHTYFKLTTFYKIIVPDLFYLSRIASADPNFTYNKIYFHICLFGVKVPDMVIITHASMNSPLTSSSLYRG